MTSGTKERLPMSDYLREIVEEMHHNGRAVNESSHVDAECWKCRLSAALAAVEREGAPAPFTFTLEEITTALDVASEGRPNWQGIKPDLLGNQLVRVMRRELERTAQSPVAPEKEGNTE